MTQSFTIPLKPISWNLIAAKNRWAYKKIKDEWQQAAFYAIREARIKPIDTFPIEIHIEARWKDKRRRDIDGVYFKGVVDTLVNMKIIPDDNLHYVSSVKITGKNGQQVICEDSMIVTLHEMNPLQQEAINVISFITL